MATPFSFEGTLTLPEGPNLPGDELPFSLTNSYDSRVEYELNIPVAPGTINLDFGTLPAAGCKAILIVYEAKAGAAPVLLAFNTSLTPIELTTGGVFLYGSPTPAAGITALSVTHTTAGKLRIWILG